MFLKGAKMTVKKVTKKDNARVKSCIREMFILRQAEIERHFLRTQTGWTHLEREIYQKVCEYIREKGLTNSLQCANELLPTINEIF